MASELLYLGFLFTITLTCICAQGTEDNEVPKIDKIEPGLALVPGSHRIIVQRKTPVLLNCSLNVTDQHLLPLKYSWYKDGNQIVVDKKDVDKNRSKPKVQLFPNGTLYLRPRRRNGGGHRKLEGVYDCYVSSRKGTVIARRVEVIVASIAKNFSLEPSSKEAFIGGMARFECNIRAEPRAHYVWHKNNIQLPQADERFTLLPSGILQISDVKLSDEGSYWCQATPYLYIVQEQPPSIRWKHSGRAPLRVITDTSSRPIKLIGKPKNISVVKGETALFECFADGNPTPTVVWKKKDSDVDISPQKLLGQGNLQINQVTPEDAGVYECIVSNSVQRITAEAVLTVLVPPKLEKSLGSFSQPVARVRPLICQVSGVPTPKITWYYNGKPVEDTELAWQIDKPSHGQKLFLYTLQEQHSGFYQCIAENTIGRVMAVSLLSIIPRDNVPRAPENLEVIAVNSTSVLVTFDQPLKLMAKSYPNVIAYNIVGNKNPPTQFLCVPQANISQECYLNRLTPYTNYSVNVQAFNPNGASAPTEKVYVQTLEDVPVDVPVLSVTSPQFHAMLLAWDLLTRAQSRGRVISYRVYYRKAGHWEETSKEISGDKTSYLITGVEPETTYEVLVIAATRVGYTKMKKWPWVTYTTPAANASSPPRLWIRYVNVTAVLLEWQAPMSSPRPLSRDQAVIGYDLELRSLNGMGEPLKHITLAASIRAHTLTGLDKEQKYEVTLVAKTQQGPSSPSTHEFELTELRTQLVPGDFQAKAVTSDGITLTWSAVPGVDVEYEICFHKELEELDKVCESSNETSFTISGLEAFRRYEFNVRALMDGIEGAFSKNLIVQTAEDRPSQPLNLTAKVVEPGSVQLNWLSPAHPKGIILSYIVMYAKEPSEQEKIMWKSITQTGTDLSYKIDGLGVGRYLFKLTAANNAGRGPATDAVSATLTSDSVKDVSADSDAEDTTNNSSAGLTNKQIGIIVGCVLGVVCLALFVLLVWLFYRRCLSRDQDPNASHSPIYRGNGHILPPPGLPVHHRPGNGHAHLIGNTPGGYGNMEMVNFNESTPMLGQIQENEQSDSKGGPHIITPNGLRPNGVIKNHKLGSSLHPHAPQDLNRSNNSEELQGLMAMGGGDTPGIASGERIQMSSLDDIDRGDDELGDQSSEDSGTGCSRHAGMLGSRDAIHPGGSSQASSPGGSSLGRHQQGWERGRQVDEIGGVFIDRSTGAVIGEVSPRAKAAKEEGGAERAAEGRTCEDNAANDRDSGHGSEAKSHGGVIHCTGDTTATNTSQGLNFDVPAPAVPGDDRLEDGVASSLPLPPPPPPPSLSVYSSPAQPSSSTPSSQQLPCSSSRSVSNTSRPQHSQRYHQRGVRQHISHTDLPPPPPPPPQSSHTLPPLQGSPAAETAATAATTTTAELNSSGSIDEGGRQRSDDSGSILSRQSEGKAAVAFSPPFPPPSPPHIA